MTVATQGSGTVAVPSGYAGVEGLEDVGQGDLVMPRISIDHKNGMFVNSVTKESWPQLNAVLLAQIKQRIMWDKEVDDQYKSPQCKSTDFQTGFPNVDPKAPTSKAFPWRISNFDPTAGPAGLYLPDVMDETGLPALPCEKCNMKEWVNGKTLCREQHVFPLMYEDPNDGTWNQAILTIQGSSIKNSKNYVAGFAMARTELYRARTLLTLKGLSRGSVVYQVVGFVKGEPTDPADHGEYSIAGRGARDYLRAFPRKRDDNAEPEVPSSNVNTPPVMVPVPGAIPASSAPVIEQSYTPPPAPSVPAAPAAVPVPAPAVPAAPAVTETVPASAPPVAPAATPEVPAAPPVAVAVPPAAAPTAAVEGDDDDLPF